MPPTSRTGGPADPASRAPSPAGAGSRPDCSHCGLPVPASLFDARRELQFCCQGCELVYSVIHEHGLQQYYDLLERTEADPRPARTSEKGYEEFDDPAFHDLYVRTTGAGLKTVDLYLEGVHCAACVWLVERVPLVLPGIAEARLDMRRSMASVTWDPAAAQLSRVARFLGSLGYPAHPYRGVKVREMRRREDRSLLIRIGIAGAAAGNVMLIAFALYGGMFHGIEAEYERLFRWASMILTLPAVFWSAGVFFKGAWGSLRARALHMDVPIVVGILAGFGWGAANTLRGTGEIYFESVTALIFLLLVGRYVQQRRQRAADDAAELLYSLAPSSARLVDEDGTRQVPLEALAEGMEVEVNAGESVPVDGTVIRGSSTVDASLLTGESLPHPVGPEDPVHAGTLNQSSPLRVRVLATGEGTRVGRLMRMVEESARRRAPVVRLADRIAAWFVAVVLGLAALTVLLWWPAGAGTAIDHSIALLIVTCPCALGLATPLAVSAAIGRASRGGVLIKGGDALERLAHPGRVFLDKTGTLTEGRTSLVRWEGRTEIQPLVLALEAQVAHPAAQAFVEAFGGRSEALPAEIERGRESTGVAGRVGSQSVHVGAPAFVAEATGEIPESYSRLVELFAREGFTPVLVAVDGKVVAAAALGDELRGDAVETVAALRDRGWEPEILSGDHPHVVEVVGKRLGIAAERCHGAVTPEDKLAAVERAVKHGPVLMVGDGINDAAALTAATVGVAVHGGAEVSMAVADVFLARPGLGALLELLQGAQRTLRVIKLNLGFSLLYNVVGASLAIAGWLDPLLAAILMPLSSLTVISHSFRARTF